MGMNMKLQQGIEETETMIDNKKTKQEELNTPENPQTIHQKPKTAPKRSQPKKNISKEETDENEANTKPKKQTFSFRAAVEDIINWKAYATATGQTMETIGTAAMKEYLINHTLTGKEQIIFEAMKERDKNK